MDTITQALLGAVTAQLGFRQRIGRDATWVGAAAAIVPDLDIFVRPFFSLAGGEVNDLTRLVMHRGMSHSLLMAPVLSVPVALIWWWFRRRNNRDEKVQAQQQPQQKNPSGGARRFWLLYACVLVAMFTHPLLDWCTSYGTQILAPLTSRRFSLDCVPIVDLIYTPLLIITLAGCWLARRLGRGRARSVSVVIGWAGFLLSVGYLSGGRVMHDWAVQKAIQAAGSPGRVVSANAYPGIGTIFLWRTVVETDNGWFVMRAHRFSRRPVYGWDKQFVAKTDNEWVRKARRLSQVQTYEWFAGGPTRAEYSFENGQHVVKFHDMRYGWPLYSAESMWPMIVVFDGSGGLVRIGREHRSHPGNRGFAFSRAWADIW
ncbi:MAG: metal-dependent hydrolase, partial [Planctomycetes bacterium]|nr:metal-dependent hydrolase [Planctomycetota bacterium]